jgi:hypothetical protein
LYYFYALMLSYIFTLIFQLNADEILNIDGIIEKALHVCVLRPLKHHIYRLFVEEYTK